MQNRNHQRGPTNGVWAAWVLTPGSNKWIITSHGLTTRGKSWLTLKCHQPWQAGKSDNCLELQTTEKITELNGGFWSQPQLITTGWHLPVLSGLTVAIPCWGSSPTGSQGLGLHLLAFEGCPVHDLKTPKAMSLWRKGSHSFSHVR